MNTDTIFEIVTKAQQAAEAFLTKQIPFVGAFAEAEKAGYVKGSAEFDLYSMAYVASLPARIETDEKGMFAGGTK